MSEQSKKKTYAAPTVTDHGAIVKETKGISGDCWEIYGSQPTPPNGPRD
jgi:hypothetical protein